jgi:hypothetical protein
LDEDLHCRNSDIGEQFSAHGHNDGIADGLVLDVQPIDYYNAYMARSNDKRCKAKLENNHAG